MREKKVVHAQTSSEHGTLYDVDIMVPIVYRDKYLRRMEHFKRCGFFNLAARKVHLTLVGSLTDWPHRDEIKAGWPASFDVSVLAVNDERPLPKISAAYLWLREQGPQARWYLRVDDDSMTDVDGLLTYIEQRHGQSAVHVMTSPWFDGYGMSGYTAYLASRGVHLPVPAREHESCISSHKAMQRVFADPTAMDFLQHFSSYGDGYGDQTLALAMLTAKVAVAINPVASKDFVADRLAMTGGHLCHVHYVDWEDTAFTKMAAALIYGTRRELTETDLETVIDRPLSFGRCIGKTITKVRLLVDGTVSGATSENELCWARTIDGLCFMKPNGMVTTVFHTLLTHGTCTWLIGPYLFESSTHFLQLH